MRKKEKKDGWDRTRQKTRMKRGFKRLGDELIKERRRKATDNLNYVA
jgi:hypothetical protein